MMRCLLASSCLVWAAAAVAQDVASAPSAALLWLDKVSGITTELDIGVGQTKPFGRLEVTLGDCRYPVEDPTSNAFAFLTIRDPAASAPVFDGWMIASSPALRALDDPRYDIWVLRCNSD